MRHGGSSSPTNPSRTEKGKKPMGGRQKTVGKVLSEVKLDDTNFLLKIQPGDQRCNNGPRRNHTPSICSSEKKYRRGGEESDIDCVAVKTAHVQTWRRILLGPKDPCFLPVQKGFNR